MVLGTNNEGFKNQNAMSGAAFEPKVSGMARQYWCFSSVCWTLGGPLG
jgi:hypothetical protein